VVYEDRPLILFKCATCGLPLTRPVRLLSELPAPPPGSIDLVPENCCWRDDRPGRTYGRFLLNRKDTINTRDHDDPCRGSGCCGPSGIDGVNMMCAGGHEVATESADCWTGPHYVELEPHTFIIEELVADTLSRLEMVQQILPRTDAFNFVGGTSYFPPRAFLNEFLLHGSDPLIQDRYLNEWKPFELSPEEYRDVLAWWVANHPGAVEDALGAESWDDWLAVIFQP
jgi:hypothetical protein